MTSRKVGVSYSVRLFRNGTPDAQVLICRGARTGNLNMLLTCSIGNAFLCEKSNTDVMAVCNACASRT